VPVAAHEHSGGKLSAEKMWAEMLAKQRTLAVSVAFDAEGRLWRARANDGHVLVDHSDDQGKTFGTPVAINAAAEAIGAEGDARPKIVVSPDGDIYISYTQLLSKPYSGNIRFSRSVDDGKTFSAPITVNDNHDIIGHRFDALAAGADGKVYLAWLDKRDEAAARKQNEAYAGSALYYAASANHGAGFGTNIKIADHSCECCRLAMAVGDDGIPALLWRHIYDGNIRDHAFVRLDGKMHPVRVSHDNWRIDACPHHGPALAAGPASTYHAVWFDDAPQSRGLFYARSQDGGKTFGAPMHFGNDSAQPGHPDVLNIDKKVFLVWKEFDGEKSAVYTMRSLDNGTTWSMPQRAAATADASDHPTLIGHGDHAYLSWNTLQEGHRIIPLNDGHP
jgi:hypothetical protein